MSTAVVARAGTVPGARSAWFHSAPFDFTLLLGVPLLTWPLVMWALHAWGHELLTQLILLTATGHYFATFVRTYGDRDLFARFRARFLLAPFALLAVSVGMFASGHGAAMLLVTAMWAFWHWLAQAFGFARIYDAKVGSHEALTSWLDKAIVVIGFVGTVTWNPGSIALFGKLFLDAGVPLPPPSLFGVVQAAVLVAAIGIGGAYAINLVLAIARGRPWSWQKQVMHSTTIGYYWFAFAYLPNVLIAHVLYELFHDVQYYAITWLTCRQRVRRPGVAAWLARMFRPGTVAAAVFVLGTMLCGGAELLGRRAMPDLVAVTLTAALLHYYYDGFIWKAREQSLGADLGIAGGLRAAVVPGLRHAALWALFVVPLLAVAAFGRTGFSPRERAEALVALAPRDFVSQAELAFQLASERQWNASLEHYEAALAANPDYSIAHLNYGAALDFVGRLDEASAQYEQALRCVDHGEAHAGAHVDLGVLLWLRGDRAGADAHFRVLGSAGTGAAIARMYGLADALPAAASERRQRLLAAVLDLAPDHVDARWRLGELYLAQRRFDIAVAHLQVVTQHAPQLVPAWVALATAQAELGQFEPARTSLQQALAREPQNAEALALQARLAGR
jgi:tetratricopeptide (TPR) repeat protein